MKKYGILIQDPDSFLTSFREIVKEELNNQKKEEPEGNETLDSPFVKIEEVCKLLNVSKTTIYQWVNKGYFTKYKISSCAYFDKEEIKNFLRQQKE
jgi:excisionase family DNA binding protein